MVNTSTVNVLKYSAFSQFQDRCGNESKPRGYQTFFLLNSAEHDICTANKSQITNNCIFCVAQQG